jgi:hypothetical protein
MDALMNSRMKIALSLALIAAGLASLAALTHLSRAGRPVEEQPSRLHADAGASISRNEPAALVAPKTQSLAPETNQLDGRANGRSGLEVTGIQARHPQLRSRLESSPGYYPPADPESMSAVTGRRAATLVSLELTGGAASLDELARRIVDRIGHRDPAALHALRVSREEFETIVWPELPQSRPITHIPVSEVWGMQTAQCLSGVDLTIGRFGGRSITFLRIDYSHEEAFRNFTLLRDVRILIRDPRDGRMIGLTMMPSVLVRHGRYKALTFKD